MTAFYTAPRKRIPLKRQAECLAFASREHGHGFWSYIARYGDITAFTMKGWPDAMKWLDLTDGLDDATETLKLVAELAQIRGDERLLRQLREAIEREKPAGEAS